MSDACPNEADLLAFISGEADPLMEGHLQSCLLCQETVALVAQSGSAAPKGGEVSLAPGDLVDRFQIVSEAGRGGMGTVYEAFDPKLGRKVALKVLHGADMLSRTRLEVEARALARLAHPNIIYVFDVGLFHDRVFMAMEFVEGQSLRAWLTSPHIPEEIVALFLQAGEGLATAHRAGIVHRDFKPDNVLVGDDGRVRVVDFGLARADVTTEDVVSLRETGPLGLALTNTGIALGTPAYMAPEQYLGEEATPSADQFSFCVSLTEALFGARPFAGNTVEELRRSVVTGQIVVPRRAEASRYWPILRRGLRRAPENRYLSLVDLLNDLRAASARRGVLPKKVAAVALVVGAGAIALVLLQGRLVRSLRIALAISAPSVLSTKAAQDLAPSASPLSGALPSFPKVVSSAPSQGVVIGTPSVALRNGAARTEGSTSKPGANGAPVLR